MTRKRHLVAPEATQKSDRKAALAAVPADSFQTDPEDRQSPENRRALDSVERRNQFISVPDQLACDSLYFSNYRWPEANQHYPDDIDSMMRFVSRYYPHARGGALYIDEPRNLREVDRCEEKRKIMKKMRLRYVVLNRAYMDPEGNLVEAAKLEDALEQLS